jgi:hypothetical protein
MKSRRFRLLALSFLPLPLLVLSAFANSDNSVNLGTAASYAVLAGSTVTNTGPSILTGDLGLSPGGGGCAPTGFPPGIVHGTTHACDGAAAQAQRDLTTAYNKAAGLSPTKSLTGKDLGGMILTPGIYFFATSAQLTGTLTLEGTPGSQFVFQIGSTLTTASSSAVIFINSLTGKQSTDPNIFWQVGSSATLGTTTAFEGNILALTSITLDTGATIGCGSALARNGAVTLDSNVIGGGCSSKSVVPEPGTLSLLGTGLAIAAGASRRKLRPSGR